MDDAQLHAWTLAMAAHCYLAGDPDETWRHRPRARGDREPSNGAPRHRPAIRRGRLVLALLTACDSRHGRQSCCPARWRVREARATQQL
jgi:hypothetical protein